MPTRQTLDELIERLRTAEQELQQELDRLLEEKSAQFQYHLERGRVVFEQSVRRWQKQYKTGVLGYILRAPLPYLLSPLCQKPRRWHWLWDLWAQIPTNGKYLSGKITSKKTQVTRMPPIFLKGN